MKKTLYFIAAGLLMASCSDKDFVPVDPSEAEGNEVSFLINNNDNGTRTVYDATGWETTADKQQIFWGSYLAAVGTDQIRVFCPEAPAGRQVSTYDVKPAATGDKRVAESVTRSADEAAGVQWGEAGTAHTFYSFYPASMCEREINSGKITARVASGQSPVTYKVVRGTTIQETDAIEWLGNNLGTADASGMTTIYGQPDMHAAVMAAKTEVSAENYGQPVALNFSVLADVLDLTINGPITPNTLAGEDAKDFIHIKNVIITSSTNPIAGQFSLDLSNYSAKGGTNGCPTGYVVTPGTNTTKTIQLNTIQQIGSDNFYPILHIRGGSPDNRGQVDKLRLRAFLMPGQIQNLNELKVTIQTDCGDYTRTLGDQGVKGLEAHIYPVKFPTFVQAGMKFDFSRWMSQMPQNTYLTELSIPGSYAAYSFNGTNTSVTTDTYIGTDYVPDKYQSYDLTGQFQKGVRSFNLNVSISRTLGWSGYTYSDPYMKENSSVKLSEVLNTIATLLNSFSDKEICIVILSPKQDQTTWGWNSEQKNMWLDKVKSVLSANESVYNK